MSSSPLLDTLARERERAVIAPADVDLRLLALAERTAGTLSLQERRKVQEGIDAWISAHPETAHESARLALNKLRSSVELLPHQDMGADVQQAIENPAAFAERTGQNAKGMLEREAAFYAGSAPTSEKILRGGATVLGAIGVVWLAKKIVGWGNGDGWFAKTVRWLGLAALGTWALNYAARSKGLPVPTPPPSAPSAFEGNPLAPAAVAPPAPPENLWVGGSLTIGSRTVRTERDGAGNTVINMGTKKFNATALTIPVFNVITKMTKNGDSFVVNDTYIVQERELVRLLDQVEAQTAPTADVTIGYAKVSKPTEQLSVKGSVLLC